MATWSFNIIKFWTLHIITETGGTPKVTSIFRPFVLCPWLPAVEPKAKQASTWKWQITYRTNHILRELLKNHIFNVGTELNKSLTTELCEVSWRWNSLVLYCESMMRTYTYHAFGLKVFLWLLEYFSDPQVTATPRVTVPLACCFQNSIVCLKLIF